ncbi:MAG TPA: serine/threonine-protein kinase [Chloroflexota bacterium]|nr:serine/threonine-protein kinase [Chloroflexota bacterium]
MRFGAGQRIDGYEITESLGAGGMSEAYRARNCQDNSQVVLKLPHPYMIGDPALFSRFQREIEIGRRLNHPNVQHVLGTGNFGTGFSPFIVMEYIEGQPLRQYMSEHAELSIEQAIDFATQITSALTYCHQQGVIHRDLKPENILVTPDGRLKLMDFGIALLQGARRVTWGSLSATVGTPDYMAPEQVRGERGDERTDVYAAGVILFELLSGQVPFQGDNPLAVMSQHVDRDPPAIRDLRPEIPVPLAAVVSRALQRDPAQRYPTMEAFAYDLTHLDEVDLTEPPNVDSGTSGLPSAGRTTLVITLTLLAMVLIGVLAELLHHIQTVP